MKFTTSRLCGGALMAISRDDLNIDLNKASDILRTNGYTIKQMDDLNIVMSWNDFEITVYPQGKVMFFPLKDKILCVKYATEILEMIQ